MSSTMLCVAVDCTSPGRLADFWSQALNYTARHELPNGAHLIAKDQQTTPWLAFIPVPEAKGAKNRLHLDLRPDDQEAEIERLLALGATRADVGQPTDAPWTVLADPEGNEFCVLPSQPA
ncbi:VOC family protein [Actinoallomurus oryzae]|uniref:VOC family protein n=1 Tax=Actinoallomurus oryzae TaxID=502180 RepID=A0ABP8R7H4_9ACTN